ncbi:PaaI family thioesterase [Mycobacterium sp. CBMA271]|uniref:PaaI family thioesterase n=1 Tax=unclassified Mycobacteroides TaxID=2618759 RepID=UPI0012DEC478|nr:MULTISPECIES: PaaI family thioesterase [unclassified Mycobacteroides]MUM18564.1 competence protein ComA [Mycobacteroides sp. CBMA 326]MUM24590.1 PaaI family thioesterase [Mycobacteroides sp. CBMA 271]
MTRNPLPTDQFPSFLGIESVSVEDGRVTAELPIRRELFAPNGFVHAAAIVGLADTLCGYGCLASLPDGATGFTTVELKTNFLGAAREGRLTGTAVPVHRGRSTQLWDATVTSEDGRTVAVFRCTQLVLWPKR